MTVTEDVTFVGSFNSILRSYEVTYIVEGVTHSTETVNYGSPANPPTVTKDSTISHVYVFSIGMLIYQILSGTTVPLPNLLNMIGLMKSSLKIMMALNLIEEIGILAQLHHIRSVNSRS